MGFGKKIDITITERTVQVRDYGRGIPLTKVIDVASKMNTGAKYDSKVFKKSVGLNGVGIKAVNALSSSFTIHAYREGKVKAVEFTEGAIVNNYDESSTQEPNGTMVSFVPDEKLFGNYHFIQEYVDTLIKNYVYLNAGLIVYFNGEKFVSKNGLLDLLEENMENEPLYPIIHLKGEDIELAMTHGTQYGEDYRSFVNGQNTTQGGTHLIALRESIVKTIREFYRKDFDASDIRASIIAAFSIKVEEPVFESQTKTKLGSKDIGPKGPSIRNFIGDFVKTNLDNYLHKHPDTAEILLKKILDSEKERKAISGIKKIARERAKKANLHNRKLRDCRVHYNSNDDNRLDTTIFITE